MHNFFYKIWHSLPIASTHCISICMRPEIDIRDLADRIASNTPTGAARSLARLLKIVTDLLSARQLAEFTRVYAREMAKLGYHFAPDPALVRFHTLQIGEEFINHKSRRCRRIEPKVVHDFRDNFTMRLEAQYIDTGTAFHIQPNEIVRRLTEETGVNP